jgi:hypothetical protein
MVSLGRFAPLASAFRTEFVRDVTKHKRVYSDAFYGRGKRGLLRAG